MRVDMSPFSHDPAGRCIRYWRVISIQGRPRPVESLYEFLWRSFQWSIFSINRADSFLFRHCPLNHRLKDFPAIEKGLSGFFFAHPLPVFNNTNLGPDLMDNLGAGLCDPETLIGQVLVYLGIL